MSIPKSLHSFGHLQLALQEIVAKEGYLGLFGRGLKTKILANGLQGLMFTVLWRIGQDMWNKREADKDAVASS